MNMQTVFDYLSGLREHNEREWYHAHKPEYQRAYSVFEALVQGLIFKLSEIDPALAMLSAKDLIYRLPRDTRFSRDKSPYNPSFRAHIAAGGKRPLPAGYYIRLEPGGSFIGGGMAASSFTQATAKIRERIAEHGDEFEAIISGELFAQNFTLLGERLKNVPRGFSKDSPYAELLKHKSWYVQYELPDPIVLDDPALIDFLADKFLLMKPLDDFINNATHGVEMP